MTYKFEFGVVSNNLGFLLSGIQLTLLVTAAALTGSLVLGLIVALARMNSKCLPCASSSRFITSSR